MIFNQLEFLLLFLPVVVIVFVALPKWRHAWLISTSFVFYGVSGFDHLLVLIAGTLWTWAVCGLRNYAGNRALLSAAIFPPLLALACYKYFHFILGSLGLNQSQIASFRLFEGVVLPAGISFFTFHLLAFAIDRYREAIKPHPTLKDFVLFMSFFPHLVAGPILRYSDVSESLAGLNRFRIDQDKTARFLGHLSAGLAAKVLLADTLGHYIKPLTGKLDSLGTFSSVFVLFGYSFQIYFDFYGYSLIAIGLGALFGFDFPKNFLQPYKSPGIREFWRRWHITLSFWIRDYLYMPLGGKQHYYRNILIVFAACGLWHGAGWNFVLWGLAHGALAALQHRYNAIWTTVAKPLRIAITFVLVSVLWTLFLFDAESAGRFFTAAASNGLRPNQVPMEAWAALVLAAIVCFALDLEKYANNAPGREAVQRNLAGGLLLGASLIFMHRSETFIYFRF